MFVFFIVDHLILLVIIIFELFNFLMTKITHWKVAFYQIRYAGHNKLGGFTIMISQNCLLYVYYLHSHFAVH